ncbi:MAG: thioredoxin-like domain-containing protein [Chloracidobacterium sp.]|nr:thioredoxin-like domain-containing protein [Chloracidobacterium sp.]MDW8218005.1 thioredoxin-like domain-containing protein [Acidobacteriota bacterium]
MPTRSLLQIGPVRAPELEGGVDWLNIPRPLSLAALRGKVVLLDFWTYCCINCLHVIADLKALEAKYPNELVVIGVHSAKFTNEKESNSIRQAIARYDIRHPVVNDANLAIWNAYAVRAWPTLVLITPDGYVASRYTGEGHRDELDRDIAALIAEAKRKGTLKPGSVETALELSKEPDRPLRFPGKVHADAASRRLFIADTGHHRVVVVDFDGGLLDVIGSGAPGTRNGPYDFAEFRYPQGLALDGDFLYVADTGNHLIRRVNLKTKQVETVAGTGKNERGDRTGPGTTIGLSSPWDLVVHERTLFIAMAGAHQIWRYNLDTGTVGWYAGTGGEGRRDGALDTALFAQPSGLATDGKRLYVADSEISAIRAIDLKDGQVTTIAGGDLFDFGDANGRGENARFQHPLGVAVADRKLYVADSYNHKLRTIDLRTRFVSNLIGAGKPGLQNDIPALFHEPGGVSYADGKLFIADTNNHVVRVVEFEPTRVRTFPIDKLNAPTPVKRKADALPNEEQVGVPAQRLIPGAGEIVVDVKLPPGFKYAPKAEQRYFVSIEAGTEGFTVPAKAMAAAGEKLRFPVTIPYTVTADGMGAFDVVVSVTYCKEGNEGFCTVTTYRFHVPFIGRAKGGTKRLILQKQIPTPAPAG